MPIEDDADRLALFDDFGVDITARTPDSTFTVRVLCDEPFVEVLSGTAGLGARRRWITARSIDLPGIEEEPDRYRFEKEGTQHRVLGPPQPDGTGMVSVRLERLDLP